MNKHTKITLDELMARKEQMVAAKKQPKRADLYVKSLDGTITIEEPSRALATEAVGMDEGIGDIYTVYECVVDPPLKSKKLQEAFECVEPMEIVEKVFAGGEISGIAAECIKLAGYGEGNVKIVDEIKN